MAALCASSLAAAAPRLVLHTTGYGAPVTGQPDGLLVIAGDRFEPTDTVVYEALERQGFPGEHPLHVPRHASASLGTAPVLQLGDPPFTMTILLPQTLQAHRSYRLWVVNGAGEWSEPMLINDPRPMWISPPYLSATSDSAGLGRRLRVLGRNLEPATGHPFQIRLHGPATYTVPADGPERLQSFVAEATLPRQLAPGLYQVSVSRDSANWIELPAQRLEIRADPPAVPKFELGEARFGGCRPDDGVDDGPCLASAIDSAGRAGGGAIVVPSGIWDVWNDANMAVPRNVALLGAAARSSIIVRHARETPPQGSGALLVLMGSNSIKRLTFRDADPITSVAQSRPMIQLGSPLDADRRGTIADVIITANVFQHVGRAIVDSGHPISHLFVTHNEFAAYDVALELPGNRFNVAVPYAIDDSVVRDNRFVPGSYLDVTARQGTMASELGASFRVDFSANTADGASVEGLQNPADSPGWRAAFFWNMSNSHEYLLVSDNRITCSGDKAGDGEAIAFDGNGDTFAFNGAQPVAGAGPDSVVVRGTLLDSQNDRPIDRDRYYVGHWIQVVEGRGIGQARRIEAYTQDLQHGRVSFRVSPRWDVPPSEHGSRVIVGREYRQVLAIGNVIDQRTPPCSKSNLTGPHGGGIVLWGSSADSTIASNRQFDTAGISFQQAYSALAPSCKSCNNSSTVQSALEIRGNRIEGEYDWDSDCSSSGIMGSFAAGPTPESPPPTLGFAITIAGNLIAHADGFRGGAIDLASTWFRGPPGADWPLLRGSVIFDNTLRDITGTAPRASCGYGQRTRIGIRLDGPGNVRDTVLYRNECDHVAVALADAGTRTLRVPSRTHAVLNECAFDSNPH